MLTFFEYLRQRAFESVVAGVQDAMATLENQPLADDADATAEKRPDVATTSIGDDRTPEKKDVVPKDPSDSLPPPRKRRGRPRKSGKKS